MVKQSWSSTTSTSAGVLPAVAVGGAAARSSGHHAREVALLVHEHGVGGGLAGQRPYRARPIPGHLLGSDHESRPTVGEGAAVEELEGVGDIGTLEHGLEGDLLAELGLGIEHAVTVVLHRHVGHLLLGGTVLLHVGPRDQREDSGKGQPHRLLQRGVRAKGEVLGGGVGRDVEHALGPAHEDHIGDAGSDSVIA
jgi:hypothetical protein